MILKRLTKDLSVGSQPAPDEISKLAREGFKAIICNRPDGEEQHQPAWAALAETARRHGMLKKQVLPPIYWNAMLKGHEWLAAPKPLAEVAKA